MKEERKTKAQLIEEPAELTKRIKQRETKDVEAGRISVSLQESESRFRTIFESSKDGIIFFDGNTRKILLGNAAMAELIGCSIDDLVGRSIPSLHPPEEWVWIEQEFQKHVRGEVSVSAGIPMLRYDGSVFSADISSSLILLEGRTYFSAFFRDVTERKQTEEAMLESEARLKAQYQGSPIPTFTWQKKGETFELVDFNPAAKGITQGEARKYLRKTAAEMYQDRPEILLDLHQCYTEKKIIKRELQSQHFMPGRIMIATYAFIPPDLIMVHAEDITERKQLEEALRESEEKFRNIFDNVSIGMSMTSLDSSVYVNQALSEMLGYTKEELSDLKWQDFTHPDDIELTQEHLEQLLSGEKNSVRFIKRYIRKDGSTLWGDLNTVLQKDNSGNPLYYISGLVDITERRRWEALIERTMRETRIRFEVSQALVGKETEDEVLDALIQQTNLYSQVLVGIFTFEITDGGLVGILRRIDTFSSGLMRQLPIGTRLTSLEFPTLKNYVSVQEFVSDNVFTDQRVDPSIQALIRQAGGTSFATFRLGDDIELLGLIVALAKPIGYFDKGKQHLYQTLAEQGVVALRAARLREQIRESQQRFQGLVETLSDLIWEVDQNGVYTYVSPKIRDLLGVEPEELLGKTPFDFMPQEEARRVSGLFETLKAARQPMVALENICRHKDGRLFVFETSGAPFFDPAGHFKGYRGVDRDITERKQIQNALQISEERFRIAAESSNDFIYEWDINTGQLEWFGAATERLNYLFSELPVTTAAFEKSIHPEDYERISKAVRRQVRYGEPYRQEYRLIGKTGNIFHIKTAGICLRNENGRAYKWIGTTSDISEHKRAEEALHQAEEKYRAIVENAVEGIFQSTADGKFLMANTALARFHAYDSPEELLADITNIGEQLYVHPEDRQRYRQIIADEGVVKGFEVQFYTKDRKIKWGSMNVRSVKGQAGRVLYFEGTIEDITARKEVEEKLQKSLEKLRKAMGGTIQAMALTVETRDPYTAGHQRRVADLARAIAQEMGLSEDQVDGLRMAGSVHDLGKISIPAEILSKPSKLSDLEFSLIKVHPQISYDILKDIDFEWPVAQIVLQHHERIDGSGYPQGLSGKAIYLEARILAVADVVEAISSHRPYRPAFGIDAALEEISKNMGSLYDPEVVEPCLRLFREKGFKFE